MNARKLVSEENDPPQDFPRTVFAIFLVLAAFSFYQIEVFAAPPAYRASGNFTSGTAAITPGYPTGGAVADDVCLLAVESENQNISLTTANGFVEVPTWSPQSAGTAATNPGSRLALFWKRTVVGDAAPTVGDSGNHTTAQIHCFSGVVTSGNPWDTGAGGNDGGANDTSGTIPGSTTTVAETLVVLITSTSYNGNSTAQCSNWVNADLASLTERTDNTNTAGLGGGHCMATGEKATAGIYATTSVTLANTSYKGAISLALKPPPPAVLSIDRASANPTSANSSVSWTVTFNKSVTGVDASDFSLVQAGGVTGASITSVTGSGTTWTVTANTGTGTVGTLGLNLVDDDSIVDSASRPLGDTGAGNGNFTGQIYSLLLIVNSINRASTNPTLANTSVSWTVIFSGSVTGVDTTDFSLVQAGGTTGASITSVTGSGTTWTVTANTGTGEIGTLGLNLVDDDTIRDGSSNRLGGTGNGNGNFTGEIYTICSPPSNIPADVNATCLCDAFGRASLNPSTIYGANWIVSTSDTTGIVPYINATSGYLRLTENTGNNAKAATVPGIFPAAGNYISVEFRHFAYGSTSNPGADGIAVTLSDYSVPAVPGGFGGSLGYAQRTGIVGFAGGWLGVALDEWGNYQNPTEGRLGGPGFIAQSVGARGSGSGMTGYRWLAGTAGLTPQIDNRTSPTPSRGFFYQVIVDARNDPASTTVAVNRDTTGTGTSYTSLINIPNVYTAATAQGFTQDPVPDNWQISFTGSTGGANNIHEIGGLRVCAQVVAPPGGGTAAGFNAIDEAYATSPATPAVQNFLSGHIYMKVAGSPFKLWVAALDNNQILTTYAAGGDKDVTIKLVDNSDGVCVIDNSQAGYCNAACTAKTAVSGGSQTLTFALSNAGKKLSTDFTINTAYKNLVAIMSDGTTSACSTDAFSVRPASVASVTSSNATNTATTGTPVFKAGADAFALTATTTGIAGNPSGYTGTLKINTAAMAALAPATTTGTLTPTVFPAATSGTPSSTATGSAFTYSEVGGFYFRGYNPATDATTPRGIYDGVAVATECAAPVTLAQCDALRALTWTGVDSISAKGNCVSSNYSNTKDANGKYGCLFGITANTGGFGRFIPAYFDVTQVYGCPHSVTPANSFTYSGQPFTVTVTAKNNSGNTTANYDGTLGLAKATTISNAGDATYFGNNTIAAADFSSGIRNQSSVTYTLPVAARETAPVTLTLRAIDTDNVSSAGHTEETAEIRSGRLNILNAYGSELVDLLLPMRVEYYSSEGWIANSNDTCSSVTLSALTNFQGNLSSGETCVQDTGNPGVSGQGCVAAGPVSERYFALPSGPTSPLASYNLYLKAPGATNDGSVDVGANLGAKTWLRFDWDGDNTEDDPSGRATFGLFRGSPRHIYQRERY